MDDFKPNSYRYKDKQQNKLPSLPEPKKVEKVVTGTVKTKKKSEFDKIKDIFISEDARNIKSFVIDDVLIPSIKKAISDIVVNGVDIILYGGSGRSNRRTTVTDRFSYDQCSQNRYARTDSRVRTSYDFDDIILETRGEAEAVLSQMDAIIDTYGVVKVSDMYDLVGKTCEYTDNKYGWTNLRNAEPIHVRDGYLLKMPKAIPID